MRIRLEHKTTFSYTVPISEAYTEMRLKPLDGNGQHCLSFSLLTEPRDDVLQYLDRFGNDVRHFDVILPHQVMIVSARSEVLTPQRFESHEKSLSPLDEYDFLSSTCYACITPEIAQFAAARAVPASPAETAFALMHAVYQHIKYEKGVTDVSSSADQAFQLQRGVCQDFSHLMLAACRSQNLPSRYVSGYIYSDGSGDSSATHAWVDVFVAGMGWLSLDPTHDTEQTDHYVRVAVGRDYADVPPTQGVFVGNAKEEMSVAVAVQKL
jgi:transglutaminase-like putative cysteine protease